MNYKFRGKAPGDGEWVYGHNLQKTPLRIFIGTTGTERWTLVRPETLGIEYALEDATKVSVYQGDIVRYAFTERGTLYNKYYVVKEGAQGPWFEELWRDYYLNPDTLEVERCTNVRCRGTKEPLNAFNNRFSTCKVVGNIWDNPELLK